jgi:hypothetical protein
MHILIGGALAAVLGYFWLIGHWYARVLMFLLLGVTFAFTLGVLFAPTGGAVVGVIIGVAIAWFVAGIPIYYWRNQIRRIYC